MECISFIKVSEIAHKKSVQCMNANILNCKVYSTSKVIFTFTLYSEISPLATLALWS